MDTLYGTIYNDILKNIQTGQLKAGDRIPSEKALSEQYGVSRITTKKALEMLCSEGYISRFPGRGSFVSNKVKAITSTAGKYIGLIMEDFAENFGTFIISGAERACSEAGYSLIIKRSFGSQENEQKAIQDLRNNGVSGLLILPVHGDNYNEAILQLVLDRYPTVLLDRQLKGMPLSFVGTDNYTAARELSEYLFKNGHKRICFISPSRDDTSSINERIDGFIKVNEEREIPADKYILTSIRGTLPGRKKGENLETDTKVICEYLLAHPEVTGILAAEYNIALTVLKAVESIGKRVPEDYEIVCFDGPENYIQRYIFTHARQDEEGIGREAVRILLESIRGSEKIEKVELPAVICKRYQNHN